MGDMVLALPPQLLHTLLPQQLWLHLSLLLLLTILPLRELPLPPLAQPSLPLQLFLMPLPQLLMQLQALLTALLCGNLDVTRTHEINQASLLIKSYYNNVLKVIYYYYNVASLSYPYLST